MAGIDNILSLIKQDAELEVKSIIDAAEAEAADIIAEAKAEGTKLADGINKGAESTYADIISRAKSSGELERRKALLLKKQELITGVIEKAKKSLTDLPDDEYFAVLYKLIKKYSIKEDGTIALGAKDLKRVPADFEAKASEAALGKLTLSAEPQNITDGFLLLYGGIDINCSFNSLFEDNSEELIDKVTELIF